jgi:hypothetical protein
MRKRQGKAASRAGRQSVPHRVKAKTSVPWLPPSSQAPPPRHGLDTVGSGVANPHRESGTRCELRQTLERQQDRRQVLALTGMQRGGNRLGDSVGIRQPLIWKGGGPLFR